MEKDGVGPMRAGWQIPGMVEPPRWALARDTVRHVGEPVAAVFAETRARAEDAAERVAVEYEVLPLVEGSDLLPLGREATRPRSTRRSLPRRTASRSSW